MPTKPSPSTDPESPNSDDRPRTPPLAIKVSIYHCAVIICALAAVALTHLLRDSLGSVTSLGIQVFAIGALGGTLLASRAVVFTVRHERYDPLRLLWQLFTPLHGAVLAGAAAIVVQGGILATSTSDPDIDQVRYRLFMLSLAFLAGFSSEVFVKRLISASEALFGEKNTLAASVRDDDSDVDPDPPGRA